MTKENFLKKIHNSPEHLVDITGFGNYFCKDLAEDFNSPQFICENGIKSFIYCPLCGRPLGDKS